MERLTAEDQLMLWPDELWPQEIACVGVLQGENLLDSTGGLKIGDVAEVIAARVQLVPRLRQLLYKPGRGLGPPLWVDAPEFDVRDHVHVLPLPAPADEAQLLLTVEQLRARRLDWSRPLWEIWLLSGLPRNRIGLFVKMHHVIGDGMAGMSTLGTLLGATEEGAVEPRQPWTPAPLPTAHELFADNVRRHIDKLGRALTMLTRPRTTLRNFGSAFPAIRELAEARAPTTSLDRVVGPDRNLALIRASLDQVKAIAHTHNAKINDVLLAIIAGGLQALLRGRGEAMEDLMLPVYVPVTLRHGQRGRLRGNLIGQMVVPIPLGVSDPGQRLQQIAAETAKRKAKTHPPLGTLFRSRIARWALLKVLDRQPVSVTTADLPGPKAPLFLAGSEMLEVFPVLPLIGKVSLGVGAISYAGQFGIMAVADRDACPDLDIFARSARDELQALTTTSVSTSDSLHS